MRGHGHHSTARLAAGLICATLLAAPALAEDEPGRDVDPDLDADFDAAPAASISLDGLARVGWRLLHGDDDGRFMQDINLREGPRLIDLEVRATADQESGDSLLDFAELTAHDIGDRASDAGLRIETTNGLRLDGTYFRDRFSYAATGDPFPRDATRERSGARMRWSPTSGLTLRAGWHRSSRRGHAFALGDSDILEQPGPAGVDADIVRTRRPFDETFDTVDVGADLSVSGWRVGLTLSGHRGLVDDERYYDVPPARRGTDPIREAFRRRAHVEGADAVLKVARSFLDDAVETTLVLVRGRQPAEADLGGSARGFDNAFEGLSARGAFRSSTSGATDLERDTMSWEFENLWHATEALDVLVSVGQEEIIDDATLRLVEQRRYDRVDVGTTTLVTARAGRTTQRMDRTLVEATYELTDDVRLRAGHETFRQDVSAPFETRGDALAGSKIRSFTRRWIAGIDFEPTDGLDVSLLARTADNDEPAATPAPETADDLVARVRWRPAPSLAISAMTRHRDTANDGRFDSVARVRSAALAATWTDASWTVDASLSRQSLLTRADTSFFLLDATGFRRVQDTVSYRTRDVVASLFVRYEFADNWRAVAGGHTARSCGDDDMEAHDLRVGLEYDIDDAVSAGFTVHSWRYDERDRSVDDYDAEGVLLWLEYRFR